MNTIHPKDRQCYIDEKYPLKIKLFCTTFDRSLDREISNKSKILFLYLA